MSKVRNSTIMLKTEGSATSMYGVKSILYLAKSKNPTSSICFISLSSASLSFRIDLITIICKMNRKELVKKKDNAIPSTPYVKLKTNISTKA